MKQFDFGTAIPSNFVFSPDGSYLVRQLVLHRRLQHLSLRAARPVRSRRSPTPRPDSSGRCRSTTTRCWCSATPAKGSSRRSSTRRRSRTSTRSRSSASRSSRSIRSLKQWAAGSPGSVPIESMITGTQQYSPLKRLGLESIYPVVAGIQGRRRRTACTPGSRIRSRLTAPA